VSLMIRYDISLQDIKKRIENLKGGAKWLTDAKSRTAKFRKAKRYKEASSSWSKIKIVYMEMQHAKCAYCERKLESGAVGKIEWDIEHYRPKSKVKAWPPAKVAKKFSYDFPLGPASNNGYYSCHMTFRITSLHVRSVILPINRISSPLQPQDAS
jgi:hypothetical protein